MARTLFAALVSLLAAVPMFADHNGVPHVKLTFGTIAFNEEKPQPGDAPNGRTRADGLPQLKTADPLLYAYLQHIAEKARPKYDLQFDIVRGNYYQILRWMRNGMIDGALVSPFIYQILLADSAHPDRQPLGVVDLHTIGLGPQIPELGDGNAPAFRALRGETPLDDPERVLAACLTALIERGSPQCTFQFVSHLSTTGFIYPLARIDEILHQNHRLHLDSPIPGTTETVRTRLLERTRFTLWHKELGGAGTRLEFSYANELYNRQRKSKSPTFVSDGKWAPLMPRQRAFADDVIAIGAITSNASVLRSILDGPAALPTQRAFTSPATLERYRDVTPVDSRTHDALRSAIDVAWPGGSGNAMWNEWYVDENFDFTVDELIGLLRNDQIVAGRTDAAAIVLPGGGVRSAYQAGMLDELYARFVVNHGAVAEWSGQPREPLVVRSIVGTSGGALMGYFAARRTPNDGRDLTTRWLDGEKVEIDPSEVFPRAGAVRCLSILVAVTIFALCTTLLWGKATTGVSPGVPAWLNATLTLLCVAAPLSVYELSQEERVVVPWGAGAVYAVLILLTHAYHSVIQPTAATAGRGTLALAIGSLLAGLAGVGHVAFNPSGGDKLGRELFLVVTGSTLVLAGVFLIGFYQGIRPVRDRVIRYVKAIGTLLLFLGSVVAIFSVAVALEYATTLELTADYWLVLAPASIVVATVIASLTAFRTKIGAFLDEGLDFWFRTSRASRVYYTPMLTLLGGGFAGVLSWVAFVAPALYDGKYGAATFLREAATAPAATAQFVAALTNLGTPPMSGEGVPLPTGDYYAVERDPKADPAFESPRLLDWNRRAFLDAVTASGSPFPIYPGKKLEHARGTAIFVDGGYTHLVPIEGAVTLMKAKQVLVVSNVKSPLENEIRKARTGIWSLLVSDAGRTFNFLFNRAQEIDEAAAADVIVATIAPVWPMTDPFLMDFRPRTIRTLVRESWLDARRRRPGRMTSWGKPTGFVGPPPHDEHHPHPQTAPAAPARKHTIRLASIGGASR
jgi:predicted acylesterase/phospholipase RssA